MRSSRTKEETPALNCQAVRVAANWLSLIDAGFISIENPGRFGGM
jgi:hypothetical protein